jgi:hypothetical protein
MGQGGKAACDSCQEIVSCRKNLWLAKMIRLEARYQNYR